MWVTFQKGCCHTTAYSLLRPRPAVLGCTALSHRCSQYGRVEYVVQYFGEKILQVLSVVAVCGGVEPRILRALAVFRDSVLQILPVLQVFRGLMMWILPALHVLRGLILWDAAKYFKVVRGSLVLLLVRPTVF